MELTKLRNIKVMGILFVVHMNGAQGPGKEIRVSEIQGEIVIIWTTPQLETAGILRRVLEAEKRLPANCEAKSVPADHRIKLKECEKKDTYLDLARELWNMPVTIIPIVIGAFGTITKGLLKGLEDLEVGGRVETIQTTALLRTARIL